MEILNNICVKGARVYRTLNKPLIRSKIDADLGLYTNEASERPIITVKMKDFPEIKLLDLILALTAVKLVFSAVKGIFSLFRS